MNVSRGFRLCLPSAAAALWLGLVLILSTSLLHAVSARSWKQRDRVDFEQGEPHGVSLTAEGPVRLGARLERLFEPEQPYVWAVAASERGPIYVSGGNEGVVYRIDAKGAGERFFKVEEPEVQALAVDASGFVYAGTVPGGRIYKVAPDGKQVWVCVTGEEYIWALLLDRQGELIAATGTEGRVLKIDATGHSKVLYDSAETHVRSLALDTRGDLLAGTDGHGLIFRVTRDGRGTVMYDAPLSEVTALALAPDGLVYAAVDGEAGRGPRPQPSRPAPSQTPPPSGEGSEGSSPSQPPPQEGSPQGGASEARPALSVEGKVLAISPDGYARDVWSSSQESILSLAITATGELLMGASSQGRLFLLDAKGGVSEIARSDSSQVTALLRRPSGAGKADDVIVGGSNLGSVSVLRSGHAPSGTLESRVFDAQSFATWGRVSWRADAPSGTAVTLQARSGNTEDPDRTWSDWGKEAADPLGSPLDVPSARFIQWRARLKTNEPSRTPELREVSIVYMQKNLPPEFRKVEVLPTGVSMQAVPAPPAAPGPEGKPAGTDGDSGTRRRPRPQARRGFDPGARSLTWQVVDPNEDDLVFDVQYRAIDEKAWKTARRRIDEDFVTFDGSALPDGTYLVRIVASDSPSNPAGQALTAEKVSAPFDVDTTPPRIERLKAEVDKGGLRLTFAASDDFSIVREAAYSVDAGDWLLARPVDGLSDGLKEAYELSLPLPAPGEHSVVVRTMDAAGNTGSGRAVVDVP
jgi:hypothetical protein